MAEEEKTIEDIKSEITEITKKLIGSINNIDSKKEKADITQEVLNQVIAGADLSKIEKAGIILYLQARRVS